MSVELDIGTLPIDWMNSSLGKHIEIIMGQAPPGADCNKEGVGTPFVKVGEFGQDRPLIREWTTKPLRMAKESDVLFCVVGATCGKVNRGADCAIGRSVAALRPLGTINRDFLFHFMFSKMMEMRASSRGSAQGVISKTDLNELSIPIPNLSEQKKMVEILEEQLSRLDAALASVRAIREKAAQFRRSLLHAAFTGMLTGHDTSDGGLPHGWSSGSLGDFCEMYQPKTISTKELIENGEFPVFGANGQIGFYNKYNHEDSEVTVTCRGATCGTVNVIPGKSWITGNAMVVRPIDNCMSKPLLSYQLQSLDFTQVITGTAQPQITRTTLTEIKVVLPPQDEQSTIVQNLEAQLSRLDVSLEIADVIERKASAMRQSLLHAAFTGELTKEWREGAHV